MVVIVGLSLLLITFVIQSPDLDLTPDLYTTPLNTLVSGKQTFDMFSPILNNFDTKDWTMKYNEA
jgi:hypothetical protein